MRKDVYQKKILELGKPRRGAFVTTWAERRVQRHQELGGLRYDDWMHGDAW